MKAGEADPAPVDMDCQASLAPVVRLAGR